MSMWHCYDGLSGDRFEVHGDNEEAVGAAVEQYILDGIDADSGEVEYNVTATAVDGSEYSFSGSVKAEESTADVPNDL